MFLATSAISERGNIVRGLSEINSYMIEYIQSMFNKYSDSSFERSGGFTNISQTTDPPSILFWLFLFSLYVQVVALLLLIKFKK